MTRIIWSDSETQSVRDAFADMTFVSDSGELCSLIEKNPEDDLQFGFVLDCSKKGFGDRLFDFVLESAELFEGNRFSYVWCCGYGRYSNFNLSALEYLLSTCTLCLSYERCLPSAQFDAVKKDVDEERVEIIRHPSFFGRMYARRKVKPYLKNISTK